MNTNVQINDYQKVILAINSLIRNAIQLEVVQKLLTEYNEKNKTNFQLFYLDEREFYKELERILEANDINELFLINSQIKSIIEQRNLLWEIKKEVTRSLVFNDNAKSLQKQYISVEEIVLKNIQNDIICLKILIKNTCLNILESLKNKFPHEKSIDIDFSFMEDKKD